MGLHYGFWNVMLLFPGAVRLLIGVLFLALVILLLWPIDKYFFILLFLIAKGLNYLIVGIARFMMAIFPRAVKYTWDDKMARRGTRNKNWLQGKCFEIQERKTKDVFREKSTWIIVICFYMITILPFFHLEKYVPERYINFFYGINRIFMNFEAKQTAGIENYPPFWIREEEVTAEPVEYEEVQIEEVKEPVYLKLDAGTSYANVRAEADMHGDKVCVVSNEDEILYQYIYEYDSERFWLKVVLPSQDNLEGWISAKVIDPEIIATLDLQN